MRSTAPQLEAGASLPGKPRSAANIDCFPSSGRSLDRPLPARKGKRFYPPATINFWTASAGNGPDSMWNLRLKFLGISQYSVKFCDKRTQFSMSPEESNPFKLQCGMHVALQSLLADFPSHPVSVCIRAFWHVRGSRNRHNSPYI